jgi:CRP-like cAMP-binding protein
MELDPSATPWHPSCDECHVAPFTAYSPTLIANPKAFAGLHRTLHRFSAEKTILREGEIPELIYTIKKGWVFTFSRLPNGQRQIYSFAVPGDLVTAESLWRCPYPLPFTIKALNQVELCALRAEEFRAALSPSEVQAQELRKMAENYYGNLFRRFADIGRRSAAGRLAQLILELNRRLSLRKLTRNGAFDFPLKQAHIGDALGLAAVYASRLLAEFRHDGLIRLEGRELTILRIEELREIADDG